MYEIYALKISERMAESPTVFMHTDYGKKFLMTYYFWLLRTDGRTILVDTGISQDELECRRISGPTREEMLARLDTKPEDIEIVVVSHLHADHFAEPEMYSNARFYIQRKEVEYWSCEIQGFECLSKPPFLHGKPSVDMSAFQKFNMTNPVIFLDGDCEVCPGLSVMLLGGHTPGHQIVKVETARGPMILCVDFADTYRNIEERIPIGNCSNLVEWMRGLIKIEQMGLPIESLIPGHDGRTMTLYPKVAEDIVKVA